MELAAIPPITRNRTEIPKFLRNLWSSGFNRDSVGRTLILSSSATGRPFRVRFCQIIRAQNPKSVCSVSWRVVRVGLLVTRRAKERHVVTVWNEEFTDSIITWFRSEIVQLSYAVVSWRPTRREFWPATFSGTLMPLIMQKTPWNIQKYL